MEKATTEAMLQLAILKGEVIKLVRRIRYSVDVDRLKRNVYSMEAR